MQKIIYIIIVVCCIAMHNNGYGTIRYVTQTATGNGSGGSWTNASSDLQLMIDQSSIGDEVRVAAGNYKPTRPDTNTAVITLNNRFNSFVMKSGVTVYGGYFGSGVFANLRVPHLYTTELDGDIGTLNNNTDNAYHVVIMPGANNATIDGFTIKNGNANGSASAIFVNGFQVGNNAGAGLYAQQSSNVNIANCKISNNAGTGFTTSFSGVTGTLEHTDIINNTTISGSHLSVGYALQSLSVYIHSNLNFRFCKIAGNTSEFGTVTIIGGSTADFYNCIFTGNSVTLNYGATINNGVFGVHGNSIYSFPNVKLLNCVFSGNKYDPAHVKSIYTDAVSLFEFKNSILWGDANATNPIVASGTGIFNIRYSVTQGQASVFNSFIPSTDNIDVDPQFVSQPSYMTAPFTAGDYHLNRCSPAITAGSNSFLNATQTVDMDGKSRIIGGAVDIGAYEYQMGVPDANGIVYVDSSAASGGDGSSWANAIPELADALKAAKYDATITKVHVAKGTYKPLYTADSMLCSSNNNRKKSFVIPDGVWVMGGHVNGQITYSGGFPQNPSILSGDIGTVNNNSDNSYHVVIAAGTNNTNTKLYNFVIENGNTDFNALSMMVNGISISGVSGSGMANQANAYLSGTNNKGADIMFCTFRNNRGYYGALSNFFCNNAMIFGCKVMNDSAAYGGGIANIGPGTVNIHHSKIQGNKALFYGGGIYASRCNLNIHNSLITGNYSYNDGGGIQTDSSTVFIGNCTIANNKAVANYGAFNHYFVTGTPVATITNSIIWGNDGAPMKNIDTTYKPQLLVNNSIVMGQTYNFGTDMIKMTPNFINPIFTTSAPSDGGDYHLFICSPAINAGSNSNFISPYGSDLDGNIRINQNKIDLGAYENTGYSLTQTPGDSLVNTNFANSCNYSEFIYPNSTLPPWQNLPNASGNLFMSIKQPATTPINGTVFPVNFSSKIRTQYGTGTTLQLSNPFGQTGYYYPINRTWAATINGNLSAPVSVRFYFDNTDSTDIATQSSFGNLQNLIVYKVNGTDPYNPSATGYKEYAYASVADTNHFSIGTYQGLRYVEFVATSFSSGTIALKTGLPLAVKLGDITATNVDTRNRVDWNTLNEENSDAFVLERSSDGKQFAGIENINAHGMPSNYTYWDEKPFDGMNYYRLKITEVNGSVAYSKTVSAFVNAKDAFALTVYPNPATDKLQVKIFGEIKGNAQISVVDIMGRIIFNQLVRSHEIDLDISILSPGIYLLRYQDAKRQEAIKIEKK